MTVSRYISSSQTLEEAVSNVSNRFTPEYDADGNATKIRTSTGTWNVTYNAENRPVRWENTDTGTVITMVFDSQGRRVEYRSETNGVQNSWQRFFYKDYLCIQVLYSNSPYNVYKEFLWDPTEPAASSPATLSLFAKKVVKRTEIAFIEYITQENLGIEKENDPENRIINDKGEVDGLKYVYQVKLPSKYPTIDFEPSCEDVK